MDNFIFKFRFLIGGLLLLIILTGLSLLFWNNYSGKNESLKNSEISELKKQNELLRAELSGNVPREIAGESDTSIDQININTADLAELDKLPGIGPARAGDIVAYREENGIFQSIEELKNISGIGDKTFENLKDLVTVGTIEETVQIE